MKKNNGSGVSGRYMVLGMIEIIGEDMDINYRHGQRISRVTRMNNEKELNMTWTNDIARHVG
jgi:hypothetical protein